MTDDQEFAEALSHLWRNRLRATTYLNGETVIRPITDKQSKYERVMTAPGRALALEKAGAKRARKAAKRK